MKNFLGLNNLSGGYDGIEIVKDITFNVGRGDFLGIIGPNGCGKTTLLRLISRVIHPAAGNIVFQDRDIARISLKEFCRKLAFVQQDTAVNFPFNVQEIVMMGRIPHLRRLQREGKKDFAAVNEALVLTDTFKLKDKKINELSSGERQRVLIAKALAQEPELLLLDEPTSHLDIGHQLQVLDLLRSLNRKQSLTIIAVLHDLNMVSEYCSRICLLEKGKLLALGIPQEVLTYQNIEALYKAVVIVKDNPLTGKPFIIPVPSERVHGH